MHIISRRVDESLMVGDDIIVTVLEIQEHCVRLGISRRDSIPEYWEQTIYLDSEETPHELQVQ